MTTIEKQKPKKHTKSRRESLLQCLPSDKCVFCGTTNWTLDCAHNKQDQMTLNKKDRRDCFLYSICSALVRVCCCLVHTDFNETVQRKEEKQTFWGLYSEVTTVIVDGKKAAAHPTWHRKTNKIEV